SLSKDRLSRMKHSRRTLLAVNVPVLLTLAGVVAMLFGCSREAPESYPSRNIELVIPYSPGGGFDIYVRALIPYVEKQLPNNVKVIPVNAAGAGGQRGATMVYRARPDGYTIGVFNLPGVLIPMLNGGNPNYDLLEVTWLATLSSDPY